MGELPSHNNAPSGCAFHPPCPVAFERYRIEGPPIADRRVVARHIRAPPVPSKPTYILDSVLQSIAVNRPGFAGGSNS